MTPACIDNLTAHNSCRSYLDHMLRNFGAPVVWDDESTYLEGVLLLSNQNELWSDQFDVTYQSQMAHISLLHMKCLTYSFCG